MYDSLVLPFRLEALLDEVHGCVEPLPELKVFDEFVFDEETL